MKKGWLNNIGERVRGVVRQALSPTFLIIFLGSALLWYSGKLNDSYDTEIPVHIRIDGKKYRFTAIVSGRGATILAQRLSLKRRLSFTLDELSSRPSRETPGAFTITPTSLVRAVNGKISDLLVVEVLDAPDFVPHVDEDEGEGAAASAAGAGKDAGDKGTGSGSGRSRGKTNDSDK